MQLSVRLLLPVCLLGTSASCTQAAGLSDLEFTNVTGGGGAGAVDCAYANLVRSEDPVAYWRLGDDDDTARDEAGTIQGGFRDVDRSQPSLVANCPDDGTARFIADTSRVAFGDVFDFSGQLAFSVELWVNVDESTSEGSIMHKLGADGGWTISFGFPLVGFRRIIAESNQDAHGSVSAGTHHVVGRYDPGVVGSEVCVFTDGRAQCDNSTGTLPDTGVPLVLGDSGFDGTVDEVAIYPYPLTAAQVSAHHELGNTTP